MIFGPITDFFRRLGFSSDYSIASREIIRISLCKFILLLVNLSEQMTL